MPTPREWPDARMSRLMDAGPPEWPLRLLDGNILATGSDTLRSLADRFSGLPDIKDFGARGDGSNDTEHFQRALDRSVGSILKISKPSSKYVVGQLIVPPNTHIQLDPGVIIESNSSLLTGSKRIFNVFEENFTMRGYGATIRMVKSGFSGEFNHAFDIYQAGGNVMIEGVYIHDCGGDGIHIGSDDANIVLRDVRCHNNRRNGGSLIGCKSFADYGGIYSGSNGAAPSIGFDIEPDVLNAVMGPVRFYGTQFIGNHGAGWQAFLGNWCQASNFVDITLVSCRSRGNGVAVVDGNRQGGYEVRRVRDVGFVPCRGHITMIDCASENENHSGFVVRDKSKNGPRVRLIRPLVINPNMSNEVSSENIPIRVETTGVDYTTLAGGVDILFPIVRDDVGNIDANALYAIGVIDIAANSPVQDVFIQEPTVEGIADIQFFSNSSKDIVVVRANPERVANSLNANILIRNVGELQTNGGSVGLVVLTLPDAVTAGDRDAYQFMVVLSNEMRIVTQGGQTIVFNGLTSSYLTSSWVGSALKVKRRSASTWEVQEASGTWAGDEAAGGYGPITIKTIDYQMIVRDGVILVDTTAGPVTITLPDPTTVRGLPFTVKKVSADGNVLTLATPSGGIDGIASQTTVVQWEGWTVKPDGANYYIMDYIKP